MERLPPAGLTGASTTAHRAVATSLAGDYFQQLLKFPPIVKISVLITNEPLEGHAFLLKTAPVGCGALAEFSGLVRPEEDGRIITALEYEAYQPMAEQQIESILRDIALEISCEEARVIHRIGIVPTGSAAIIFQVAAKHRAEAFALLTRFMDRLKQDVPIWKIRAI